MSSEHPPTILAGCDGGGRGRQAISFARVIAELTGARLLVAAVYPHPSLPFPPPVGHHVDERREAELAIRAVRDELAPGARAVAVPGLSPAHALCSLAEEQQAATVVVGSRHGADRHMGDADHALQLLRSAHTAVVVTPDDPPSPGALRQITVGFDGGAGAHDALDEAIALARAAGAELRLLTVISAERNAWWIGGQEPVPPEVVEGWVQEHTLALAELARDALRDAPDVPATCDVLPGNPVEHLLEAAADSDLLVLGSRRWATLSRLALGTVAEPVVRRSPCPTLVVPRRRKHDVGAPTLRETARS